MAGFSPEDAQFTHCEISGGGEHSINISPPLSKLVKITEAHKGRYVKLMRYKNADYESHKRYGVDFLWGITKNNKWIPVVQDENGKFLSHFANCPGAGKHRSVK